MTLSLALVVPRPAIPPIATREDLIDTLFMAAELEHAIMVQYLYAAFSVDRENPALAPAHQELARTFVIELLKIARQEMAHLSMVTNLLIAVGAAPDFDRPNLPIQRGYYALDVRLALLPFSDEFLDLMTKLEEPVADAHVPPTADYPTVAAIYDRIDDGIVALGSPGTPTAATLFIGANEPQISGVDFGVGPGQVYYDTILLPVTDLASARAAIALIRMQGEGANATDPNSHFAIVQRLNGLWNALPPDVQRAIVKPMPKNPLAKQRGDVDPNADCVVLSDPRAVALANAANRTYELLLLLLARLYGANDATAEDREMYRKYAFFPLMTIVIRPVAEIIDDLPAGDGRHCAACTFELDGPIRTFPDRRAFHIQLSERLAHLAAEYARVAAMPEVSPRLAYVAQNVAYVRDRIDAYIAGRPAI
jgi:Ferritin-like